MRYQTGDRRWLRGDVPTPDLIYFSVILNSIQDLYN